MAGPSLQVKGLDSLPEVIDAVSELKSVGASNKTIADALRNADIPKSLQQAVQILSEELPPDYKVSVYQQQLAYPSHPNP